MNQEQPPPPPSPSATTNLTIKIPNTTQKPKKEILTNIVPATSPYNSPSLISPPSSAFVSALQSPYISPRATGDHHEETDDIPTTSNTPPSERSDFSNNPMPKIVNCVQIPSSDTNTASNNPPRVSFSFPIPRVSFQKGSVSPANAKLRSCDVYIGYHGQNPNLTRFCKWVKSELELQGIACFVADRAKYSDSQSHEVADRVICSVTFGVVVVTKDSLLSYLSLEEIRFFSQKKNLIPLFFDTDINEVVNLLGQNADSKEGKEVIDGLSKSHEFKLEANEGNWRSCVSKTAAILRGKLGRMSVAEKEIENIDEIQLSRSRFFVGREKELAEIEAAFFGCRGIESENVVNDGRERTPGTSEGLADEESEGDGGRKGKFISLEVGKCKEPKLEAWVEPVIGRNSLKRPKYKKTKSGKYKNIASSIVCINGGPGMGKTELALEFAHRYSQRYKMVLWVGGECRYFRQNIFNLSMNLGLDISADEEKERGRIRSFDEQETEAFKRVKREVFRDMPYLLIIDNLETEKDWWEGKDLHDLIPRNTGGSHVIITTRLPRVMSFDPMQLQPLPLKDAILLMKGRRKKEYPAQDVEILAKFDEKLGRSSFGLSVIGSLLSELAIAPSTLFEAINDIGLEEFSSHFDEVFWGNNKFLLKVLIFCITILQEDNETRNVLASKMLLVGAWFAPLPVSANLLAAAATSINGSTNRFKQWAKCANMTFFCCSGFIESQTSKSEEDSALVLVKLGLARRSNRHPGCYILLHPITQTFAKLKGGLLPAKATIQGIRKLGNPVSNSDHLWALAFLVFGYKSEPPLVQLKAHDMVLFIKKTALPLAIKAFTTFSRCNSSLELLKVCTNVLEEVEKSFVSQIQDWCHGSLCWKNKMSSHQRIDEYVWQDVTLLKATLLETRAKLLMRGGCFDNGEELCRTCISIRTVMLGHNHAQTLAAQETLAKLVRMSSKI
ncbi:putative AAA+ ATPase domain, P-loop containing nucleoside triphosphate hydrolase, TIR [Helianthus annuus]|nr:putative AAA+ ATPase domain, P-loop containing nucleoside triphosphate hydrolase, TIR [Helianthus annuus]KAJ0874491.1 putative AAA+ ATPase domain, P-loop containing nucleoside triphosphate hydrolase, TIR [Helianthus annuus]